MDEPTWISVYSRMYRERIMLLSSYIDDNFANQMIATLLYLESEDSRSPVAMYFNVRGLLAPTFDCQQRLPTRSCRPGPCATRPMLCRAASSPAGRRRQHQVGPRIARHHEDDAV
jgi:hypothetical protein